MKHLQAYTFEIMLDGLQSKHIKRSAGSCRTVSKDNRKSQAQFACVSCDCTANTDVNAVENILAAELSVLDCGEAVQSGVSMQQEVAEITKYEVSHV